jgi:tellurite methyltransferase
MVNPYNERYKQAECYWGRHPSQICHKVLEMMPTGRSIRLLDIGCGEGRNAVFFARRGYEVTAFDSSSTGVEKTKTIAAEFSVKVDVFEADIKEFRLKEEFDVILSTGALHYIPEELKKEVLENYKSYTQKDGLNVHSVIIKKPFIQRAPDAEETAHLWKSGELFTYYHDWKIELCEEAIFDCNSSGIPHRHAVNRIIARKV